MAILLLAFDTTTGKTVAMPSGGFVDYVEQVTGSPKQNFDISATYDFNADHKIDAWVDGRDQLPTTDFTKNHTTNTISFSEAVPVGKWVKIRVYLI